jgi:hypothetical protein
MIALHHRQPKAARQADACIVGDEGGVDVQEVEPATSQPLTLLFEVPEAQDAVLRIEGQIAGRDATDLERLGILPAVVRGDQDTRSLVNKR